MATFTLSKENFEEIVTREGIVLVDCWAPWCGPCRMFGPVFESASDRHSEHVFGKLNTEEEPEMATFLEVQSIPTLMVFRDGILLFRQAGALPEAALDEIISQVEALDMAEVKSRIAEQTAVA